MSDAMIETETKTQGDFDHQRANGWPDFHPEDFCHRCGRPNISWHIDGAIWNPVMRPDGPDAPWKWEEIICPVCFVELAQAKCERGVIWELRVSLVAHRGGEELKALAEAHNGGSA